MEQLQIQHICKCYKPNTDALSDVSFSVEQGSFVSVIGPSGSGKTTLFAILNGSIDSDQGSIVLNGEILNKKNKKRIQKQIGTIYQDFRLIESVSCLTNVLNAALPDMHLMPAMFGLFSEAQKKEAQQLLIRVGLEDKITETLSNLSGGQKQRVAIARALMRHPALLLADEPVAALDPVTGRQILDLLMDIQKKEHLTILMNSHNLELSRLCSDRLIGLSSGRIVYDGTQEGLSPAVLAAIYGKGSEAII